MFLFFFFFCFYRFVLFSLFLFFSFFLFFKFCFFFLSSTKDKINMLGFLTLGMVKGGITRDAFTQKVAATEKPNNQKDTTATDAQFSNVLIS